MLIISEKCYTNLLTNRYITAMILHTILGNYRTKLTAPNKPPK